MGCSPCCAVPVNFSQYFYFTGFFLTSIACWLLRDYGGSALDFSPLNKCVDPAYPANTACLGQNAVLRISFGTFMFFALHMLLLLGVTSKSAVRLPLHTGFWPIKLLLWGGLIGCTFPMDNSVLQGFGEAARVFSGFFIVLQLIIVLEFVYCVNEWLLQRDSCMPVLVVGAALMIGGSFTGIGFLYHFYTPYSSCSLNIWFVTSTILFFLLYGGISISPLRNESAGLFTSAAVLLYCAYYTWSALNSEPPSHSCSSTSPGANKTIQIIGFVIAIVALGYSTMSGGTSSQAFNLHDGDDGSSGGDDEQLAYRPDFFHCMFMLAACYMAMIFVGWDLGEAGAQGEFALDRGWGSTWVKIGASWLCAILYTWSLVAHRVLHNRTF